MFFARCRFPVGAQAPRLCTEPTGEAPVAPQEHRNMFPQEKRTMFFARCRFPVGAQAPRLCTEPTGEGACRPTGTYAPPLLARKALALRSVSYDTVVTANHVSPHVMPAAMSEIQ